MHRINHYLMRNFWKCCLKIKKIVEGIIVLRKDTQKQNSHILRTFKDFDFNFQPSIDRRVINDICTCCFIKERRNVVFIGNPGTGNYRKFLFMERNKHINLF